MRRLRVLVVNLALIVLSLILADILVQLCDAAAKAYLARMQLPSRTGILFEPGFEGHYKVHDYECYEAINSLGIRDREITLEKGKTFRILAIGDSFTYGWGVNLEATWVKRLETNLRQQGWDVEVLNLGRPGGDPHEYARIAQCAIPILKPDMVLVGVLTGDDLQQCLSPVIMVFDHYANLIRLVRHLRAQHAAPRPDAPIKRSSDEMRAWYAETAQEMLKDMRGQERQRYDALEPDVKEAFLGGGLNPWIIRSSTSEPGYFLNTVDLRALTLPIEGMAHYLRKIRKSAEHEGAPVVVLAIPEGFNVNEAAYTNIQRIGFSVVPDMLVTDVPDQAMERACRKACLPLVCVSDQMRQHKQDPHLYFELDQHFSASGNALYADLITPYISDRMRMVRGSGP